MTSDGRLDGHPILPGLPFAWCKRCHGLIVLDDDGLAGLHLTACGRFCTLSPYPEQAQTCSGWCTRCRTIVTGCAGDPDRPCGRRLCGECGVHKIGEHMHRAFCCNDRPLARMAWNWTEVTCGGCWAVAPRGELAAALAIRSLRRSLRAIDLDPDAAKLVCADGEARLSVPRPGADLFIRAEGERPRALLAIARDVRRLRRADASTAAVAL